jgi:endothelin-converting enzyme
VRMFLSFVTVNVLIHELMKHAFDSAGRLYNQEGKLKEWWTNYTSEGFNVKQDCIVKQYSGIPDLPFV